MVATSERKWKLAVDDQELVTVREAYRAGQFMKAYDAALAIGAIEDWGGTEAQLLGGRLVHQLGGARFGDLLHLRAYRESPNDPEACYYMAHRLLSRRGPLPTWEFLKRVGRLDRASDEVRADWLAMHANVLGTLREFDAAESFLGEAERLMPGRPWLLVERSSLLEMEDRYDDALAAAEEAFERSPWYVPAIFARAGTLLLAGRQADAEEFLAEAIGRVESCLVAAMLAGIQFERGRFADARLSLDRYEALAPMMGKQERNWLAGRGSDVAYRLGERAVAAGFARECKEPFFLAIADRMADETIAPREVRLQVGFVRQHHETCVPATLTAISGFWGKEVRHLDVAEAICYDGTPDHRERKWAESNGWAVREFTITWDAAVALLDRGVPFTLTTVGVENAHLQAVIGYDAVRKTLLIRDPSLPQEGEALADPFLARYRAVGPRGMAMVPAERASLLAGLDLPEAGLYDLVYRLNTALHRHDRDTAATMLEALNSEVPAHRLTKHARRLLSFYDCDASAQLRAVEELLADFPDDVNLRLAQLACLRELGRRDDRLALYREAADGKSPDPTLLRDYARELLADAREHRLAERLARRALSYRRTDASVVSTLARIAWEAGELPRSVELARFASCLADKDESLAMSYFATARHLHREDEPLRLLEARVRRLGTLSSQPARTLHGALVQLGRRDEARDVLASALAARPADGELLLYAAEEDAAIGEMDRAAERLERARGLCRRPDWLRAAAGLARNRGDLPTSLSLWRQVLLIEPLAPDANGAVAQLLAETDGRPAAIAQLRAACAAFPFSYILHRMLIGWLRDGEPDELERAIRVLLQVHPADASGFRELAMALSRQGRHAEALEAVATASALDPSSTNEAAVRGAVLSRAGRVAEARDAYREAIRRDIDNELAIDWLLESADTQAERKDDLRFLGRELERQVTFGDGLLAFARRARGTLDGDRIVDLLERALDARPDLWHTWSALVRERIERGELEKALDQAVRATARFPLLPRTWLDLAAVHSARQDAESEREAIGRALRISPGSGEAARTLAASLEREGKYDESRPVLERALSSSPADPYNHGFLADTLWHLGEKDLAVERIVNAVRLDPGYEWAWSTLRDWTTELERTGVVEALARELTSQRPGDRRAWLALARVLDGPDTQDERLDALEAALRIDPRHVGAHDLKAELLAGAGRYDEALAACRPAALDGRFPVVLCGRAAWVEAARGDRKLACDRMREALANNPDYGWGWMRLAEWTRQIGTKEEYLAAAEGAARAMPDWPLALGYCGEARSLVGDRPGAKASLRKALELAPGYSFARMELFDVELEDGELDAAGKTLEALKERGEDGDPFLLSREVQWLAATKDRTSAMAALSRLVVARSTHGDWPWEAADRAFEKAGWAYAADGLYFEGLRRPDLAPVVGKLWADRWVAMKQWRKRRQLESIMDTGGDAADEALCAYIRGLGKVGSVVRTWWFIRKHGERLRGKTSSWAIAGYALARSGRLRATARWLADWPTRQDLETWMLLNAVIANRGLGRLEEAARAGRHAVAISPRGHDPYHQVWLLIDDLIDGRLDEARPVLATIKVTGLDPSTRYLLALARIVADTMVAARSGDGRVRRRAAREARLRTRELRGQARIAPEYLPAVLRTYGRLMKAMCRRLGGWRGAILRLSLRGENPQGSPWL